MLKLTPLSIFIFLALMTTILGQKCNKPKGKVGDVRYDGCDKYKCVRASKKKGKWVGPNPATDICCNMTGSWVEPGAEIISFSDDECFEIIKRCEETEEGPAMSTAVVNHCEAESEGAQDAVCSACWRVIYEDVYKYEANCFARNVLTWSSVEINQTPGYANYWATPVDQGGAFVIDMGCSNSYNTLELVNTHSADLRDRTTTAFSLFLGDTPDPDLMVISDFMADSRLDADPLPLQTFTFPSAVGRYVKFEVLGWEGVGGGLQYFNLLNQEVSPPLTSSLTITGPGHDNVEQEMTFLPDYNETLISIPAHGNNIAQEVVLQGLGGVNQVVSPLIAYVREEACYVTELPEEFNPSENAGEDGETSSVNSAESLDQYFVNQDFYQIYEGSYEYNELSRSTKSKCAGKVIWRGHYEQLSQEAWELKQEEEYFNLTESGNFKMKLRKVDTEDRQSGCSLSQWYGCTTNTWSGTGYEHSCWYWQLEEADGVLHNVMHVHGIMQACLVCTRFCPEDGITPPPGEVCDCDQINNMEQFLACYYDQWYQCPPGYQFCAGTINACLPSYYQCYSDNTNSTAYTNGTTNTTTPMVPGPVAGP